jgi:hypothetical protein
VCIRIVLTAREVQTGVSTDVREVPVNRAFEPYALDSIGNNRDADAGGYQSDDGGRLHHFARNARPKTRVRAYVEDLPVKTGATPHVDTSRTVHP